jgi:hypothetical protein
MRFTSATGLGWKREKADDTLMLLLESTVLDSAGASDLGVADVVGVAAGVTVAAASVFATSFTETVGISLTDGVGVSLTMVVVVVVGGSSLVGVVGEGVSLLSSLSCRPVFRRARANHSGSLVSAGLV